MKKAIGWCTAQYKCCYFLQKLLWRSDTIMN